MHFNYCRRKYIYPLAIRKRLRGIIVLGTAYTQQGSYCIGPITQSTKISGISDCDITKISKIDYNSLETKRARI